MNKSQNYITVQWIEGTGEGVPMFDAVTMCVGVGQGYAAIIESV
ncbi:hypothetical protein [Flavivirga sp. 57AJ16]|nr:hypothetical protein [Flavivirga sp. 57AJ16]MDD7888162.1 hypothetical protein [Flavivirga sp. 57AJ16]